MNRKLLILALSPLGIQLWCCTSCNPQIQKAIFDSTFYPNLFTMLSAFLVLTLLVILLTFIAHKRHVANILRYPDRQVFSPVPLTSAAMVLGIGLGGFLDGIWLHQILQWHEMLSNKIMPITVLAKSVNMFWDGVFHFFCWIVVIIGIVLLWKVLRRTDVDRSGKVLTGGMLIGWGLFNLIEGIIDHHLLELHYVKESSPEPEIWNIGFLVVSALLIGIGCIIIKSRKKNVINN